MARYVPTLQLHIHVGSVHLYSSTLTVVSSIIAHITISLVRMELHVPIQQRHTHVEHALQISWDRIVLPSTTATTITNHVRTELFVLTH